MQYNIYLLHSSIFKFKNAGSFLYKVVQYFSIFCSLYIFDMRPSFLFDYLILYVQHVVTTYILLLLHIFLFIFLVLFDILLLQSICFSGPKYYTNFCCSCGFSFFWILWLIVYFETLGYCALIVGVGCLFKN